MTAIRETIIAAVDTALWATSALEVERMPSGDPALFPALHIHDDGQSQLEAEAFASRFTLALSIEGFVEGSGGAAAHAALNALHAQAVQAICALENPAANIEAIEPGDLRVAVAALSSARRLAFSQDFAITFAHRRGDPETL